MESIELDNNRIHILLHSIAELSDNDLIVELQARGIDMTSAIGGLSGYVQNITTSEKVRILRRFCSFMLSLFHVTVLVFL